MAISDDSRTATVGDLKEVRRAVDVYAEQDAADHRSIRTDTRADIKELREDIGSMSSDITALKVDSASQNGKLDTLIARTASKERLQEKAADTQALATVAKKDHSRNLIRVAFGGFFTILGAVVHHFFG